MSVNESSASQGAMNDTGTAEEIDDNNQLEYNPQVDNNMEQYEEKQNIIQDSDDTEGFFGFKTIMIIIAILFLLLAFYYFYWRNSSSGGGEFEVEGDYEE